MHDSTEKSLSGESLPIVLLKIHGGLPSSIPPNLVYQNFLLDIEMIDIKYDDIH